MNIKKNLLRLGRWQCISSTNHHCLSAGWMRRGWWWWAGGDLMRCIIISVTVIVLSDSSLTNLNFSVTKNEFTWNIDAVIALINRHFGDGGERRMVVAHRGCQFCFSKLCKFLSNSESHDFICHNLADLTWPQTITTTGATLSTIGHD